MIMLGLSLVISDCTKNRSLPPSQSSPQYLASTPLSSIAPSTPQPGSIGYIMSHPWHPDSSNRDATDAQFQREKARCFVTANQTPDNGGTRSYLVDLIFINCLKAAGWEPEGEGAPPLQTGETKRTPPVTDQQQKDAMMAAVACMSANDHDDGISDAATIGHALLSACSKEFRRSWRTFGIVVVDKDTLNKLNAVDLDTATKFVLNQRELLDSVKRCIDQAGHVASAAAAANPELLDSLLKRYDNYVEKIIKEPRSCPPF